MLRRWLCPKPELPPTYDWVADRIARKDYKGMTKVQGIAVHEELSRRTMEALRPSRAEHDCAYMKHRIKTLHDWCAGDATCPDEITTELNRILSTV